MSCYNGHVWTSTLYPLPKYARCDCGKLTWAEAEVMPCARIAALEAQVAAVSRVLCGNDVFPGDLAQYVKNEVVGREEAERDRDTLRAALQRCATAMEGLAPYIPQSGGTADVYWGEMLGEALAHAKEVLDG